MKSFREIKNIFDNKVDKKVRSFIYTVVFVVLWILCMKYVWLLTIVVAILIGLGVYNFILERL